MKIHLNASNNIKTGRQMVVAMLFSGGIPEVHATLAIPPTFPRPVSPKPEGVNQCAWWAMCLLQDAVF